MGRSEFDPGAKNRRPWNAGRKIGAKRALKPQQVWAIRFWLDQKRRLRDRAMFDLAIDSKLCGCDIVKIKIGDLVRGGQVRSRAIVIQQKTGRPVQFELLDPARNSLLAWLERREGTLDDFVFPSRTNHASHISLSGQVFLNHLAHEIDAVGAMPCHGPLSFKGPAPGQFLSSFLSGPRGPLQIRGSRFNAD